MPTDNEGLSPADWPSQHQEKLDSLRPRFEPLASIALPTTPGKYIDREGDRWTLDTNGQWFDQDGYTRPTSDNWILVAAAPFTLIQQG